MPHIMPHIFTKCFRYWYYVIASPVNRVWTAIKDIWLSQLPAMTWSVPMNNWSAFYRCLYTTASYLSVVRTSPLESPLVRIRTKVHSRSLTRCVGLSITSLLVKSVFSCFEVKVYHLGPLKTAGLTDDCPKLTLRRRKNVSYLKRTFIFVTSIEGWLNMTPKYNCVVLFYNTNLKKDWCFSLFNLIWMGRFKLKVLKTSFSRVEKMLWMKLFKLS